MNLVGLFSTAVLSLTLVAAVPVYAQEQHEQKEEKAKPAQEEKKAEPAKKAEQEKSARPEEKGAQQQEKNNKQEEKTAQEQHAQQGKTEQRAEHAAGGRIPAERYKANFGREHTFHVSQAEYNGGRRFQYGGYWFGFADPWPSNWLYTQDVFVVEINGMYYLCNPAYPGINIALNVTM